MIQQLTYLMNMEYSKAEIRHRFKDWLAAWNDHNLDKVMDLFHDKIVFENWTGVIITGSAALRHSWASWFANHGGFIFEEEEICFDEQEQKMFFRWQLRSPSLEKRFLQAPEIRRGVDILHFSDGKIIKKLTYSKTTLRIGNHLISLQAK